MFSSQCLHDLDITHCFKELIKGEEKRRGEEGREMEGGEGEGRGRREERKRGGGRERGTRKEKRKGGGWLTVECG